MVSNCKRREEREDPVVPATFEQLPTFKIFTMSHVPLQTSGTYSKSAEAQSPAHKKETCLKLGIYFAFHSSQEHHYN